MFQAMWAGGLAGVSSSTQGSLPSSLDRDGLGNWATTLELCNNQRDFTEDGNCRTLKKQNVDANYEKCYYRNFKLSLDQWT